MTTTVLEKLTRRESLNRTEAETLMRAIMSGALTDPQVAGILVGLRAKGETVDEIAGFARAMRAKSTRIRLRANDAVDTCGTGGDAASTFNVSTATALVAAGMGVTVAKHGNRAVSSSCGSADVLEALGVNITLDPVKGSVLIDRTGIGFLFAPSFHPAMKHAATARRDLGLRTVFNLLGPMTNPAGVRRQLIGVYDPRLTETVALVLQKLGSHRVYVVHGEDGCDEVSITGATTVSELKDGKVRTYRFHPDSVGIPLAAPQAIEGGTAEQNAEHIESVLSGAPGPRRNVVLLNAAFAALAAGRANSVAHGVTMAAQSIDTGAARDKLEQLKRVSHEIAAEAA